MSDEDIKIAIERLVDNYPKDLSFDSTHISVTFFAGTRNSQKNTAEMSQQALLNIFSNCCTQMESTLHSQIPNKFLEYAYHLCLLVALESVGFHSLLELRM